MTNKIHEWKSLYPIGKELFQFLNENINSFNDLERAAAFFIYNRITFSGTTLSGGYSEGAFQGRFTESSISRLEELYPIMQNIKITNFDYEDVVNANGRNVFLFLDPPYFSATKSALYGKKGDLHKGFDHKRFASVMKNNKHKWLITYDDSEYIRNLFSFAYITPWTLTYGMRNVSKNADNTGKELFISNFPIPTFSSPSQLSIF